MNVCTFIYDKSLGLDVLPMIVTVVYIVFIKGAVMKKEPLSENNIERR